MESRDDKLLRERLLALPLEAPPAAAWNAIRAQLQSRPSTRLRRQSPWWLALAACLMLLTVLPVLRHAPLAPASTPPVTALVERSQALEAEIRTLRARGSDLADVQYQWESAIENDLALVDVGLAARSPHTESLWRERVRLLEELKTATQLDTGPLLLQARLD